MNEPTNLDLQRGLEATNAKVAKIERAVLGEPDMNNPGLIGDMAQVKKQVEPVADIGRRVAVIYRLFWVLIPLMLALAVDGAISRISKQLMLRPHNGPPQWEQTK